MAAKSPVKASLDNLQYFFHVGLFYKRANGDGAFYSLILGYLVAVTFILVKIYDIAPNITDIHFLLQVPALFIICVLLNVLISNLTPPPAPEKVKKMTRSSSVFQEETKELKGLPWYKNYRILVIILG